MKLNIRIFEVSKLRSEESLKYQGLLIKNMMILLIFIQQIMKQSNPANTKISGSKNTALPASKAVSKKEPSLKQKSAVTKANKYKMDFIKKDNFDTMHHKLNITEINELHVKYVLDCIEGMFKNRFLYITTHKDGQILGSGDAKLYGLTLQIQGAGLSPKHAQLKFDGFKNFDVLDFVSENGTWMNIPKEGVEIKDGQYFSIGPFVVNFTFSVPINEIEEICMCFHISYMSDILQYNGIKTLSQLLAAEYNNFKDYPFEEKDKEKLIRVCSEAKKWYIENKVYKRINANFMNEPLNQFSIQIGWEPYYFSNDPDFLFSCKNPIAQLIRGRIIPNEKVFSRIQPGKQFPLSLHSQLKIGNLMFQLKRFNSGIGIDIGYRPSMEDGLLIDEDVGGSEWKLISLFAVFDGHGGNQCMQFIKSRLIDKIKQWSKMLDQAGDLNQMMKILMNKTFFELDHEFYKKYPQIGMTCGTTALVMIVVESKVYVFSIGDCKGYLFRNDVLYQLNLDHLPSRGDERLRIENAGGFIQYDRLMGKCTLSRCFGQFQYKNLEDYENQMKGKPKSYLSCIPDVVSFDIDPTKDDFILLSTDGIFQSMTIAQITDFISERYSKLEAQQSPNKILSSIIENCKIMTPDSDNMAVILIIIRKGLVGAAKAW